MSQPRPIQTCDVATAANRLRAVSPEPLIVDVREMDEFIEARVPGAVLVPLSGFAETFERLPRDRPLLVMCASGRRSMVAADHLQRHGYEDVTNVSGGIIAWRDAGLPVKGGRPAPGEGELPPAEEPKPA
jgi:rhodanese-related sulfurtransferase